MNNPIIENNIFKACSRALSSNKDAVLIFNIGALSCLRETSKDYRETSEKEKKFFDFINLVSAYSGNPIHCVTGQKNNAIKPARAAFDDLVHTGRLPASAQFTVLKSKTEPADKTDEVIFPQKNPIAVSLFSYPNDLHRHYGLKSTRDSIRIAPAHLMNHL